MEVFEVEEVVSDLSEISLDDLLNRRLVLVNDEVNSFEWVIECLVSVLGHSFIQAEQCALLTHYKGKCSIKEGSYEELEKYKDALIIRKLNVIIE